MQRLKNFFGDEIVVVERSFVNHEHVGTMIFALCFCYGQHDPWVHTLTRSQLLEGPKYESQIEVSGKARSRGALPSSQHLKGVEERAKAPGWD
jgi:hypothetical protein